VVPVLDPVKGIFDQGVVQGSDQDAPLGPHPEIAVGIDNMSDNHAVTPGNHFKEVSAIEPAGETVAVKLENDPAARQVFRHTVPHRAMAAPGALLQQDVKFHGGPILHGPQLIRRPGEGVQQSPEIGCRCLNFPFVPVVDLHFLLPIVAR
jgi:hypothetical protein